MDYKLIKLSTSSLPAIFLEYVNEGSYFAVLCALVDIVLASRNAFTISVWASMDAS